MPIDHLCSGTDLKLILSLDESGKWDIELTSSPKTIITKSTLVRMKQCTLHANYHVQPLESDIMYSSPVNSWFSEWPAYLHVNKPHIHTCHFCYMRAHQTHLCPTYKYITRLKGPTTKQKSICQQWLINVKKATITLMTELKSYRNLLIFKDFMPVTFTASSTKQWAGTHVTILKSKQRRKYF